MSCASNNSTEAMNPQEGLVLGDNTEKLKRKRSSSVSCTLNMSNKIFRLSNFNSIKDSEESVADLCTPKKIKMCPDDSDVNMVIVENLDCALVHKKILRGEIRAVKPQKNAKKFELYSVCRKLKFVETNKIVRHFFLCTTCETVLNINLSTHHNTLKRHFLKCTGSREDIPGLLYVEKICTFILRYIFFN